MKNLFFSVVAIAATLFSLNVQAQLYPQTTSTACTGSDDLVWDCGNVGAGTSSPATQLEVELGTGFDAFSAMGPLNFEGFTAADVANLTTAASGTGDNLAVVGYSKEDDSRNYGGMFIGEGNEDAGDALNVGVTGITLGSADTCTGLCSITACSGDVNFGISASAVGASSVNIGGTFSAIGGATRNIGIQPTAMGGTYNWSASFAGADVHIGEDLGIGSAFDPYASTPAFPTEKLDVDGNGRFRNVTSGTYANDLNITANGTLTTSSSDARLKTDVEGLGNVLDRVLQLEGKSYYWKNDNVKAKKDIGFIAQDVKGLFPEVVFTNQVDGYMGINYSRFPAILATAIQEQQIMIDEKDEVITEQQEQIDDLNDRLARLEALLLDNSGNNGVTKPVIQTGNPVNASNMGFLEQNKPNPFSKTTTIFYSLNDVTFSNAYISIMSIDGKQLTQKRLDDVNQGQVEISLDQFETGIYFYSLVVDGNIVATKPMVKM